MTKLKDLGEPHTRHWIDNCSIDDLQRAYQHAKHRAEFLSDELSGYFSGGVREPKSNPLYVELHLARSDEAFYRQALKLKTKKDGRNDQA